MPIASIWMIVAASFFSLAALFVKYASSYYSVYEIIMYRSLIGVLVCGFLLWKTKTTLATAHPWGHLFRCLIGTLSITLGAYTVSIIPISIAQTLSYTGPLWFCLLLSITYLRQGKPINYWTLAMVFVGFIGVCLMMRPEAIARFSLLGLITGILAGATAGTADFMIRRLSEQKEPKERIVFYFTLLGTLLGAIATTLDQWHGHTLRSATFVFGVGIFATLAQLSLTAAWTYGAPLLNAVFAFSAIPVSVFLGLFFLGESLDTTTALGITIIFFAGCLASVFSIHKPAK